MQPPTKIKAPACTPLEELPVGFGLHVGSFLDQQCHVVKAASLDGDVQRCLTCGVCEAARSGVLHTSSPRKSSKVEKS